MINPLIQKVVAAYSGSASSRRAVLYGIILSKQYKCSLKVVYIVDTAAIKMLTLNKFMVAPEGKKIKEHLMEDGKRELEYVASLAKSKAVEIETEIREGAVWSEIISCADESGADLILLGGTSSVQALSSIGHSVVGRQDAEIIGSAHCSVMAVREKNIEDLFKML